MKEAIVSSGPKVKIIDSPIPKAGPGQVVTKIVFAASNPKDWKRPLYWGAKGTGNQGDEHAGIVHEVGEGVYETKPGDRVAAMHEMKTPGGSYACLEIDRYRSTEGDNRSIDDQLDQFWVSLSLSTLILSTS
ncbi:unnamed protein product [Fusarium langsethiae]|nr:unnamed protein product [Fusarium langsethiae]GKU16427.1 unnamed protein product [Fusarium langsethiae]